MYHNGVFAKTSSIEKTIEGILTRLGVAFDSQFPLGPFALDFAIPQARMAIEADGDYHHSNPILYPNGPKDAIQRRNADRDKAKNSYLLKKGWHLLRYWESDIRAAGFALILKRDLVALGVAMATGLVGPDETA